MRKKVSVDDLAVGMLVEEVCGSWLANPFWRSRFVLSDARELALMRASKIREVWINVDDGGDVASPTEPVVLESTAHALTQPARATEPLALLIEPVPIAEELSRAAAICAAAKGAVISMFQEVRMGNVVDVSAITELVEDISSSVARNASALISLARLKAADDYTYLHSVAVCAMMIALARQLGMDADSVRAAGVAGLMHDMGKALVPVEILNKPGKLTEVEFAAVRRHPELGHQLLQGSATVDAVTLDVCLHHHEKVDGSGYPKGHKGDAISMFARMGAVCDVYDAITSNRPYKNGWDPAESMRRMAEWAGGHFDPMVFQAFAKSVGIYPVGSLVRLRSERIGVVIEQTDKSLTTPIVRVFLNAKSGQRFAPQDVDLSVLGSTEKIIVREDPAKWKIPDLNALWSGTA